MHDVPDEELVERSRHGDPRALAELYRRYAPSLLGYLQRITGGRADAEDILQETFLRVFEGRGRYAERGRFRSWLFTVATRMAADRQRRARRHEALAPLALSVLRPSPPTDPEHAAEHHDLALVVESVLADLPASYAQAFYLRVHEDWSYRDMAAACGELEGTLRSRVHHTMKRVQAVLRNLEAAEDSSGGQAARPGTPGEPARPTLGGKKEKQP